MYDKQKESHGGTATFVWIVTSVVRLIFRPYPGLPAWPGNGFNGGGMFAAAMVMGSLGYWLQRRLARWLMARHGENLSAGTERTIFNYGIGLLLLEAALSVLFCFWVFNSFFGHTR